MTTFGEMVIHRLADGTPEIVRADPTIGIALEMLDEIRDGKCYPWATADGDQITFKDKTQTFAYRIVAFDRPYTYIAEMVHESRFAQGGVVKPGCYLVGESGPELVDLPAGSVIRPHGDDGSLQAV